MTLKEIIDDLEAQIAWRGPGGQPQGHVVMPRSEAMELLAHMQMLNCILTYVLEKDRQETKR